MQWQFAHADGSYDRIYLHVEHGDTTETLARGDWLLYTPTNDAGTAGGANTRTYRVESTAGNRSLIVAGVVDVVPATPQGTSANLATTNRFPPFLLLAWGFHDAAKVNVVTADITAPFGLVMSAAAGVAEQQTVSYTADAAGVLLARNDAAGMIGVSYTNGVAASGVELLNVLVKCI